MSVHWQTQPIKVAGAKEDRHDWHLCPLLLAAGPPGWVSLSPPPPLPRPWSICLLATNKKHGLGPQRSLTRGLGLQPSLPKLQFLQNGPHKAHHFIIYEGDRSWGHEEALQEGDLSFLLWVVAVFLQKRVLGFLSGNPGQPQAAGPELAAVQTAGEVCAILGTRCPGARGCHPADGRE